MYRRCYLATFVITDVNDTSFYLFVSIYILTFGLSNLIIKCNVCNRLSIALVIIEELGKDNTIDDIFFFFDEIVGKVKL